MCAYSDINIGSGDRLCQVLKVALRTFVAAGTGPLTLR